MIQFQNKLEHAFSFGCQIRHDTKLCDYCLSHFGQDPKLEIPLKNQHICLKSTISRFGLVVSCNSSLMDFDTCFKTQLVRICSNQNTYIPLTQEKINDELESLSKIVKPNNHLFIYTNIQRDWTLLNLFRTNVNIWLLLDYPNSSMAFFNIHDNIVAISLLGENKENQHPLLSCFNEIRRETLTQLMNRLQVDLAGSYKPIMTSQKPKSTFFGFG